MPTIPVRLLAQEQVGLMAEAVVPEEQEMPRELLKLRQQREVLVVPAALETAAAEVALTHLKTISRLLLSRVHLLLLVQVVALVFQVVTLSLMARRVPPRVYVQRGARREAQGALELQALAILKPAAVLLQQVQQGLGALRA
jgi:hypothetical protein